MDNQKMGRYIAARRKETNMSQRDLAQRLHLTRQAISKWESGKSVPDPDTLLQLADLFGVTVEEILNGERHFPCNGEDTLPPVYPYMVPPPFPLPKEPPVCESVRPAIRCRVGWLLGIPAVVLAILACLIPLVKIVFYSFTYFNLLESPRYIGMRNYLELFKDPLFGLSVRNTLFYFLIVGGMALLLGWLFGSSAARLPLPVGIILGVLFGIGSLSVLTPGWLGYLFSSDSCGLVNSWLLQRGIVEQPIHWSVYSNGLQAMMLFLLCLGPSYLIFYVGSRSGRRRAAWHVGITAIPLLMVAGFLLPLSVVGFPSLDYRAHWLPLMIYDYGCIRFDVGFACAIIVVFILLTAILLIPGHLLVWAGAVLSRRGGSPSRRVGIGHWCGGAFGFVLGIWLQIPWILTLSTALKPLEELFRFPASFFPSKPTGENFITALDMLVDKPGLASLPLGILLSLPFYIFLVLPTAAGLVFLRNKGKNVVAAMWFGCTALLPFVMFSFDLYVQIANSRILSILTAYTSTPFLPLNVLLTAWVLQKSTVGCPTFSIWFRQGKRLAFTTTALLAAGLFSSLSVVFATKPIVLNETLKFPLQLLNGLFGGGAARLGVQSAADLMLLGVGVLLILLLVVILAMERVARIPLRGTEMQNAGTEEML